MSFPISTAHVLRSLCLLPCVLLLGISTPPATTPSGTAAADSPDGWRKRLETDAHAMHDAIQAHHPGPFDSGNPGFSRLLDSGLARALERAQDTRDFGGYWWALREYQASFDDGHLQLATQPGAPTLPARWPGFLTRYDAGRHVVAVGAAQEASLPEEGAELIACDGIAADALAEQLVGHFRGRWSLESQRLEHGGRLFIDAANPWITPPQRCQFRVQGQPRDYTLQWRELPDAEFEPMLARTQAGARTSIGLRGTYGNRGLWLSMGRFDGNPGSEAYGQLTALMQQLRDEKRVASADFVVLDVRGNGGGSSHWSRLIAEQLWGDARVQAQKIGSDAVDWRASPENLAYIEKIRTQIGQQAQPDPQVMEWADTVIAGLKQSLAQSRPLWRQTDSDDTDQPSTPKQPARLKPGARVYILADGSCASACLDALDLWKALGAAQLGRTTSADTVYMEIRGHRMPSSLAAIGVPMKVYRGRPRGNNQPYEPDLAFNARMDDDLAIESWLLGLADTGSPR